MGKITGTDKDDILLGTAGADIFDGGIGADTMTGFGGNDVYIVDNAMDKVVEALSGAAGGIDLVQSAITFTLGDNVENLTLTGTDKIDGWGNELANVITGNGAANSLHGGLGDDTLIGGQGSDTYYVESKGDKVIEAKDGGTDTVVTAVSYSLAALGNVEGLYLVGEVNGTGNALNNYIYGSSANNVINGGAGNDYMQGGDGNDTYYVDNALDLVQEKSGEGFDDTIVSTIAFESVKANVENYVFNVKSAVSFVADDAPNTITGGSANDTIDGAGGADQLDGGKGADTLIGGSGNDYYYVDNAGDSVVETGADSNDWVISTVTIGKLMEGIESAALHGKANINLTGNAADNVLFGNAGNNVIDGGKGADYMSGHHGSDIYIVDSAGDTVSEDNESGTDLVRSAVNFTLGDFVENLTLTGSAVSGYGNSLANVITGNDGKNYLDGKEGADTLSGGKGDDVYVVDNAKDKVIEALTAAKDGGHDEIRSDLNFSLASLVNVEDLTLLNGISGTGNALDNRIVGNMENNILNGGAGADILVGNEGDDTYYIDNAGDQVIEGSNLGSGIDTIISKIALTSLVANVENYTFDTNVAINLTFGAEDNTVRGGAKGDILAGGGGINWIEGRAGNDILTSGSDSDRLDGGTGADQMTGGKGNDAYVVDNLGDLVIEAAMGGTGDIVLSSISLSKLMDNVEDVELQGKAAINATGNELDNRIFGNASANKLVGLDGDDYLNGRDGGDTLTGGAGHDQFAFSLTKFGGASHDGHDTITDFVKAEDVLKFDVDDVDGSGATDLNDLLASISSVVDHGLGKAVDVFFANGSEITFNGAGTGAVDSITDLVANAATQIQLS